MNIHRLIECPIRKLTRIEKQLIERKSGNTSYKWVTTACAVLELQGGEGGEKITIPPGFLTDGSSGGPDIGNAWLFHDWCYATHKIGTKECTIYDADQLMIEILKFERAPIYARLFTCISNCNPCCLFSSAWRNSGDRGPEFLKDFY